MNESEKIASWLDDSNPHKKPGPGQTAPQPRALIPRHKAQEYETAKKSCMKQWIKDAVLLGTGLWLIGYLLSLALFFSPFAGIMGWILLAVCTPVTIVIAWWWFRPRDLVLSYYAGVGVAWTALAVVLDYLFIVYLLHATYYGPDVFVYYSLTFLIPVGVGLYLIRSRKKPVAK